MRCLPVAAAILVVTSVTGGAAVAQAASTPAPLTLTGTVQTIIQETPPGIPADGNDTLKVLRVGATVVALSADSLAATKDGTSVSVTVAPAADGTAKVLSSQTLATPAPAPTDTASSFAGAAAAPAKVQSSAAVPPAHQLYVAIVVPKGLKADPKITDATVRAMVVKASTYWSSQTGGQVTFSTVKVLPVYTSAFACGTSTTRAGLTVSMWNEALAKLPEANGPGKHLVVVAPTGAETLVGPTGVGCSFGLGSIGADPTMGNVVFVSGLTQSQLAHELGHNLGLYHSNSLRCGTSQDKPLVGTSFPGCTATPYDDLFDVMGYSGVNYGEGNLNAVHLDGMGLLPNAVRKITSSTLVTTAQITPLSTATDGRTLKITDDSGANYFVEYRTNSGLDTVAARNPWAPSWGVQVLRDDPNAPPSAGSYELDATPTSAAYEYNRAIPVGGTFVAASGNVTIKVSAADTTSATVIVTYAASVPSSVSLAIPATAKLKATITAVTTVTDQYGRALPNWGVSLQKAAAGSASWVTVASLTTPATGTTSFAFANAASGSYRWVTAAGTGAPSKYSPAISVTSTP